MFAFNEGASGNAYGVFGDVPDIHTAAARFVAQRSSAGDWILVKASRGMRLERVVNALAKDAG